MRYLLVLIVLTACVDELPTCPGSDDLVCPRGTQCVLGTCLVEPSACGAFEDGRRCGDGAQICLAGACVASTCGDGFRDAVLGEACDEGAANSDLEPDACRTTCQPAACGDGVLDRGEDPFCLDIVGRVTAPADELRLVRADLDGDGQNDLLASYRDGEQMAVATWRVEGSGRIGDLEVIARFADAFSSTPPALLFADLDGDGEPELAVGDRDEAGQARVQLLQRTDGVWSVAATVELLALEIVELVSFDADGDGLVDLLAATRDAPGFVGRLVTLRGRVGELPTTVDDVQYISRAFSFALAEIDGDGRPEAVLGRGETGVEYVEVQTFDGAGTIGPALWFTPRPTTVVPVVADVTGLTHDDIILSALDLVQVVGYRTVRDPFVEPRVELLTQFVPGRVSAVGVVDLDDDERPDVVALDSEGLSVARGDGTAFEHVVLDLLPSAVVTSPGVDRELVLVGTRAGQTEIALVRGGDGVIGGARPVTGGLALSTAIADTVVVDVDANGGNDLLVLNQSRDLEVLLDPRDDPHWEDHLVYYSEGPLSVLEPDPIGMDVGDLDADGRIDLMLGAVIADGTHELRVFLAAAGPMHATQPVDLVLPHAGKRIVAVDVDGDEHLDVIAFDPVSGQLSLLRNPAGAGQLRAAETSQLPAGARQLDVGDVSGDDVGDLLVVDAGGVLSIRRGERGEDGSIRWPSVWRERPDVVSIAVHDGLVAVAGTDGHVELLSLATGDFVAQQPLLASEGVTDVAFLDLNNDGRMDLVLLDAGISVHLGAADGFAGGQSFSSAPHGQRQMRGGDVDGDGVTDLVVVLDAAVEWYRGQP